MRRVRVPFDDSYFERLQHCGNYVRADSRIYFLRTLHRWLGNRSPVLDAGCGDGYYAQRLAATRVVVGLDVAPAGLERARSAGLAGAIVLACAQALPFRSGLFDAVLALDVVEHLLAPECFLAEAWRVLAPGGRLILSTPNPCSWGRRWRGDAWFGLRDGTHVSIRPVDEWRSAIRASGFRILRDGTDGLWDLPYEVPMPNALQKAVFVPVNVGIRSLLGCVPWVGGENYIALARRA